MAHEIYSNDSMVSAGNKVPWHGLGTVLADAGLSAGTALTAAKLDWLNVQEDVFDGDMTRVDGFKINRRSDDKTVLGIVNEGWTPVQNFELMEIAEALGQIDGLDFKPVIETAGSLRGGKVVWALIQTGQRQFHGSEHKAFMLLSNGHTAGRGLRGTATDVRVVCNNTLTAAERADSALFITHTSNVKARLDSAIKLLKWGNDSLDATFAIYRALESAKVSADAAVQFFADLLPNAEVQPSAPRIVGEMFNLFRHGAGNEGTTAFDLVNAVTDWVDHSKSYRDDANAGERRFLNSTMSGDGDRMKRSALKHANQLFAVTA